MASAKYADKLLGGSELCKSASCLVSKKMVIPFAFMDSCIETPQDHIIEGVELTSVVMRSLSVFKCIKG